MSKAIKLYWSTSKPNLGDWLSPFIVASFTSRQIEHAPAKRAELMAIGSILQKAKNHWWTPTMDVWGSGLIEDCKPFKLKHNIHAVRGKLTRERIVGCGDVACGDPGLLLADIHSCNISPGKRFKVGLVPHYSEREDRLVHSFIEQTHDSVFLDIYDDLETFVEKMLACDFILSSSLHGLVIADSYGIANQWVVISDKVEGDNFKFRDYYSVFDMPEPEFRELPGLTSEEIDKLMLSYRRPGLAETKRALSSAFPEHLKN